MTKFTKAQILAMCDMPWMYEHQLRAEAKRRKIAIASVIPIGEVVERLRNAVEAK